MKFILTIVWKSGKEERFSFKSERERDKRAAQFEKIGTVVSISKDRAVR